MEPETIYSNDYAPDPRSTRETFAFLMTRPESFVTEGACASCREAELDAVNRLLGPAKLDALRRWYDADRARRMS